MNESITQSEFARRHGVTRQAIGDLVTRGVINLTDGKLDEDASLASIVQIRDPARAGTIISGPQLEMTTADLKPAPAATAPEGQGDPASTQEYVGFHAAKTRRELAEAKLSELKLAEKLGELIRIDQLEPELRLMMGAFKIEVTSLADRIKSEIDALHGIDVDIVLLEEHINATLAQLARYDPERVGTGAPAGGADGAAAENGHNDLGEAEPAPVGQNDRPTGPLQPGHHALGSGNP